MNRTAVSVLKEHPKNLFFTLGFGYLTSCIYWDLCKLENLIVKQIVLPVSVRFVALQYIIQHVALYVIMCASRTGVCKGLNIYDFKIHIILILVAMPCMNGILIGAQQHNKYIN